MTDADAFEKSLELVAEKCGDPVEVVYNQIYARHPEVQKLFVLDTDAGARGHMLNEALACGMDLLTSNTYATTFIASERMNHAGYDIGDDVFESFYSIVFEVFREASGVDWTADMDRAWQAVMDRVAKARL